VRAVGALFFFAMGGIRRAALHARTDVIRLAILVAFTIISLWLPRMMR